MDDPERNDLADGNFLCDFAAKLGSVRRPSAERPQQRRRSGEEKARIVRESFWPWERVRDVARRYGRAQKPSSAWRTLTWRGKLALPSSAGPEPEPTFATLEVDPPPAPEP